MENNAVLSNSLKKAASEGLNRLTGLLPKRWTVLRADREPTVLGRRTEALRDLKADRRRPDAIWELRAPDGTVLTVVVEVKSRFEPKDVPFVATQLDAMRDIGEPLLIAPFISARSQSLLQDRGISFLDARGNVSIEFDRPAVLLRVQGEAKPSEPSREPRRSLRGPITGRIVRFLCDFRPPFGVRQIARETNVSPGGISRILDFLDRESYITRGESGAVTSVEWSPLLRRWAEDLAKEREQQLFFLPRGLNELRLKLADTDLRYAISGSWAASSYALVAPPAEGFVYVRNVSAAAKTLGLRVSTRVTNVRLVEAFDRVAFDRSVEVDGLKMAAPTQILADLWTQPVRSSDEITAFEDWMRKNENVWRTA